uniref:OTU domain-containing protein n=1 Tax=Phytophthora ramorum TaxID=164328 RepID=H3H573_PHYRM
MGASQKSAAKTAKPTVRGSKRYDQFQRSEAMGQFGELAYPDSDEDNHDEMEVDEDAASSDADAEHQLGANAEHERDDAPYVFTGVKLHPMIAQSEQAEGGTDEEMKETTPKGVSEASAVPTDVNQVPRHLAPVKARLKCNTAGRKKELRQEGKVTARVASGRKVTTNTITRASRLIKSSTSGKAAITNMQRSMDRYMENVKPTTAQQALSNAPEPDMADASQMNDSDIVDSTPDSQDEVVAGTTRTGTAPGDQDSPIQVQHWLCSFKGAEVKVGANGQCAFLALHASMVNVKGPAIKNTQAVVKDATDLKWYIYSLMMKNLRKDVEAKLVDPIAECASLYPDRPTFTTSAAATAARCVHYDNARGRSIAKTVPATFWAGPHELRAMAQYIREPIIVVDVNANNDAHVQRYGYRHHRLEDGTDHESGMVTALTDRAATDYLTACWSLHVLPTFLILRHNERHFSGVHHHEDVFFAVES